MKLPFWVCHQKKERCFKINGKPMFLCSRCFGLYIFMILGFLLSLIFNLNHYFGRDYLLFFTIFFSIPLLLDSIIQFFKLRESNNLLRSITGSLSGLICGIDLHYLFF